MAHVFFGNPIPDIHFFNKSQYMFYHIQNYLTSTTDSPLNKSAIANIRVKPRVTPGLKYIKHYVMTFLLTEIISQL